jgi:TonB-linked SusC/RagA family outer membrane protein
MKKNLLLTMLFTLTCWFAFAQSKVSGTVTSADDGSGIPGVSVQIKGTSKGTQTDLDGKYTIEAASGQTLVYSFIGMSSKEVKVGNQSTINVSLSSDEKVLSEVVVTAIGIQRDKKALGYSVASIKSDKVVNISEPDPLRAMQGKMTGVNIQGGGGAPGQSTRIQIRGISSLTGNTQPLFVVDGVPFDNSVNASTGASEGLQYSNRMADLDPNTIESINVLKGAAAAALYGSRAANGVVIITTKGASKTAKKGLGITLNSSYTAEQISGIPDYQSSYGQGSSNNYNGGFIGNWGAPFAEVVDNLNATYGTNYSKVIVPGYAEGYVPNQIGNGIPFTRARNYGGLFPELMEGGTAVPLKYQPYDFIKDFFDTGQLVDNSVNITNSSEKGNLNVSLGRMGQSGIVPNSNFTRTTMGVGGLANLSKNFIVSGSVNYVNSHQKTPQSGAGYFADIAGTSEQSIYSRLFFLPRSYDLMGLPFENPIDGSNIFYRALDNPLWIVKNNYYESNVNRAFGNIAASWDVKEWLNLTAKGGVNTYTDNRRSIFRPGGVGVALGRVWTEDLGFIEQDYNYLATLTPKLPNDFSLKAIVGANFNQRDNDRRRVTGDQIISTGTNITSATATQVVNRDESFQRRVYGVFSDISLGYKWVYVNFTARNDWSSTLPAGKNSYFYPSASASFILSDAMKLPTIINSLKLRAAYASVASSPDPYQILTTFRIDNPFRSGSVTNRATLRNRLGNKDLRPEFTNEIEIGLDARLWSDRIGIEATYFQRQSKDLIVYASLPRSTGFEEEIVNLGEISNKGWEVGLDLTPVKLSNGLTWNIFSAFTSIRSKVVSAGPAGEIFLGGSDLSSLGTIHRNGYSVGSIFGSLNYRDSEGNVLINQETGMPIPKPASDIIGDPNKKFQLSVNNSLSFKGFTLTAMLDWVKGGDIFSFTAASLQARGMLKDSEVREPMRVVPGVYGDPSTGEPILDENGKTIKNTTAVNAFDYHFSDGFGYYGADEVNVYDASTIRLREVTFGYLIPNKFLSKTPFSNARISVSGRNLWFNAYNMLKGVNLDPEVMGTVADTNIQGFDFGGTPTTKRYGVNLSVSF